MQEFQIMVTGNDIQSIQEFVNCIGDDSLHSVNRTWTDKLTLVKTSTALQYNYCQVDTTHRIDFYVATIPSHFECFESIDTDEFKAMVMLVDAKKKPDLSQVEQSINSHIEYCRDFAMVLVVANLSEASGMFLQQVNQMIKNNDWLIPVLEVDPNDPVDVSLAIETLLYFKKPIGSK